MSNTVILHDTLNPMLEKLRSKPLPLMKKLYYDNNINRCEYIIESIFEDDDKICYSTYTYLIGLGKDVVYSKSKSKSSSGFTYHKSTKKVKV